LLITNRPIRRKKERGKKEKLVKKKYVPQKVVSAIHNKKPPKLTQ